jgi:hypothetical protein
MLPEIRLIKVKTGRGYFFRKVKAVDDIVMDFFAVVGTRGVSFSVELATFC